MPLSKYNGNLCLECILQRSFPSKTRFFTGVKGNIIFNLKQIRPLYPPQIYITLHHLRHPIIIITPIKRESHESFNYSQCKTCIQIQIVPSLLPQFLQNIRNIFNLSSTLMPNFIEIFNSSLLQSLNAPLQSHRKYSPLLALSNVPLPNERNGPPS